jgi:PEP-CTERM motif
MGKPTMIGSVIEVPALINLTPENLFMTWFTQQRLSQRSRSIRATGLRSLLALATVGATLGHLSAAQASLFSIDLKTAGDGLLTRDSATGLEWLDLAPTQNLSYDAVSKGAGGFTTTEGFRFATQAELTGLLASANQEPTSFTTSDPNIRYFNFIGDPKGVYWINKFLGSVSSFDDASLRSGASVTIATAGYFGAPNADGTIGGAKPFLSQLASRPFPGQPAQVSALGLLQIFNTPDNQAGYGSFLVRSAATRHVPEPGSLVGLGLLAVVGWKRRSRLA